MKYKQVRSVVIALGVVGVGVGAYVWTSRVPAPEVPAAVIAETQALATPSAPLDAPATPQPVSAPEPLPDPLPDPLPEVAAAPAPQSAKARDPLLILARVLLDAPAKSEQNEDYLRGQGAKFALYDDDGDGHWDRAKIDYERDGVWDETWTRDHDTVARTLEVSGQRLVLRGDTWELATE